MPIAKGLNNVIKEFQELIKKLTVNKKNENYLNLLKLKLKPIWQFLDDYKIKRFN